MKKTRRMRRGSDLHLEFYEDRGRMLPEETRWDDAPSCVVLAGDIGGAGRRRATLEL